MMIRRLLSLIIGLAMLISIAMVAARQVGQHRLLQTLVILAENQQHQPNLTLLYLVDTQTGHIEPISSGHTWAASSQVGRMLFSASPNRGIEELFYTDALSIQPRRLTSVSLLAFQPTLSPDGTQLVYFSSHPRNYSDIYWMNLSEQMIVNLTDTPDMNEQMMVWSPDGTQLAYLRDGDMYLYQFSTQQHTRLTQSGDYYEKPAFSPDGRWLAGLQLLGDGLQLSAVRVDYDEVRTFRFDSPPKFNPPTWTPDSQAILLALATNDIVTVDIDTDQVEVLLIGDTATRRRYPQIAPDGRLTFFEQGQVWQVVDDRPMPYTPPFLDVKPPLEWFMIP